MYIIVKILLNIKKLDNTLKKYTVIFTKNNNEINIETENFKLNPNSTSLNFIKMI